MISYRPAVHSLTPSQPTVHPPSYLLIHLCVFTQLPINWPTIYPSTNPSVYPPTHTAIYSFTHIFTHSSIYLPLPPSSIHPYPFTYHLSLHPCSHPTIYSPSTLPSILLSIQQANQSFLYMSYMRCWKVGNCGGHEYLSDIFVYLPSVEIQIQMDHELATENREVNCRRHSQEAGSRSLPYKTSQLLENQMVAQEELMQGFSRSVAWI